MKKDYILQKILSLMPADNHVPKGVLYSRLKTAVQNDLSETMRQLVGDKDVEAHRTLNDIILTVKNKKK